MKWLPGTSVEVRSASEIVRTLDERGTLRGLPFMPEMLAFCGQRLRVLAKVDQTCALIGSGGAFSMRRFDGEDVLLLDGARCDGSAHDGCQRACMLFWHAAWLKHSGDATQPAESSPAEAARLPTRAPSGGYACQNTELSQATRPASRRDRAMSIARGILAGTHSLWSMWSLLVVPMARQIVERLGADLQLRGQQAKTPDTQLGLQPGEWVRVKSKKEIVGTLDAGGKNRGLEFTPAMHNCCGRAFRVRQRLERMILETGEMRELRNTVILEGAICDGRVLVGGCLRNDFHFWREAWLTRLDEAEASARSIRGR
jgi:hypothetical protein